MVLNDRNKSELTELKRLRIARGLTGDDRVEIKDIRHRTCGFRVVQNTTPLVLGGV